MWRWAYQSGGISTRRVWIQRDFTIYSIYWLTCAQITSKHSLKWTRFSVCKGHSVLPDQHSSTRRWALRSSGCLDEKAALSQGCLTVRGAAVGSCQHTKACGCHRLDSWLRLQSSWRIPYHGTQSSKCKEGLQDAGCTGSSSSSECCTSPHDCVRIHSRAVVSTAGQGATSVYTEKCVSWIPVQRNDVMQLGQGISNSPLQP